MSMQEATSQEFGLTAPLLPRAPRAPTKKAKAKKAAPKARDPNGNASLTANATAVKAGPTVYPKTKKTWTGYMIATTLKAADTVAATKLHKKNAARAGYPPAKPLDLKWMAAKGYIVLA